MSRNDESGVYDCYSRLGRVWALRNVEKVGGQGMSDMIKCDRCNRLMYTDSRSPKGAYWKVTADGINGYSTIHLCRNCYLDFYKFLNDPIPEDELRPYDESDWGWDEA